MTGAFFNRNSGTGWRRNVDGRRRCHNVKGDAMGLGEDRDGIRPDFIRHVAVGSNPVGTDHAQIDFPLLHDDSGHTVRDQGDGNAVFHQLPSRQPGPLKDGPGFIHKNVNLFPLLHRRPDHSQSRTISGGCQGPCIAMRQNVVPILDEMGSFLAHGLTHGNIFPLNRQRFLYESRLDFRHRAVAVFP